MTPPDALHSRTFGEGDRRALAVHCTLAHAGAWRGMAGFLHDSLTIDAIDMPGHGKSADWPGGGDFLTYCCAAAEGHLTEHIDLIGHSFGAVIALRLALEHPARIRSLTLIEPVFFAVARVDSPTVFADYLAESAPFEEALQTGDAGRAARLFNRTWGNGTRWDDFRPASRAYMTDRISLVDAQKPALVDDNGALLRPGLMEQAELPCLLLAGGESPAIVHRINAGLAQRLPRAESRLIPGAGHMLPMTHPQQVAAEIAHLLEKS